MQHNLEQKSFLKIGASLFPFQYVSENLMAILANPPIYCRSTQTLPCLHFVMAFYLSK